MKSKIKESNPLFFIFFLFIINIILFPHILLKSEIRLIIDGTNGKRILHDYYNPSSVIINGINKASCKDNCPLENGLNNVTILFDQELKSSAYMFEKIENIIEIDLSNFNASKIKNMEKMFCCCLNLKQITFGNIDTSLVKNMALMFSECKQLISIDLSNFNTSSVTSMYSMFWHCENLKSLDASSFNTDKVTTMFDMFGYCYKLEFVNVSSFDTSNVEIMQGMFVDCKKLKYLDLSNFNLSKVANIDHMFKECTSLVYLNLLHSIININCRTYDTFLNISDIKYCIDDASSASVLQKNSNCSNICFQDNIKVDDEKKECLESCNQKFEYNNICYKNCPEGTFKAFINKNICINHVPENFYLDSDIYKECFYKCKKCKKSGNETNNNCEICKDNFITINNQCYSICNYYYYFDNNNNYACTSNYSCPENYKLISGKKQCIDQCKNDDKYIYEFNNTCYQNCPNGSSLISEINLCIKEEGKKTNLTIEEKNKKIITYKEYIQKGYMNNIIKNVIETKEDYIII